MARKREKWDQAGKRKTVLFTDQHGREWAAVKDIYTDAPIGPMSPVGWTPVVWQGQALVPPAHVLRFDDTRPGTVTIEYDVWRRDLVASHSQWAQQAGSYAAAMYGDKAMDALENPPPALLNVMGPKPMPADLVEAMAVGNRWILGLSSARPDWATEFFPVEVAPHAPSRFLDASEEMVSAGRVRNEKGRFVAAGEG